MELHNLNDSARQIYVHRMKKQLELEQEELKQLIGIHVTNRHNSDKLACQEIFQNLCFEKNGKIKTFASEMKKYAAETTSDHCFPNVLFDNICIVKDTIRFTTTFRTFSHSICISEENETLRVFPANSSLANFETFSLPESSVNSLDLSIRTKIWPQIQKLSEKFSE